MSWDPPHWTPHTSILERMFMIQTSPMPGMSSMREYTQLLLQLYVRPHFRKYMLYLTHQGPKELEQKRRGSTAAKGENRSCIQIHSTTTVSHKWCALFACRKCKQCLTHYLAKEMITLALEFACKHLFVM